MPPTPNRRPRPINPFDNPSTTGLFSNPNGTYIANPFPTTAAIGGTGQYGAMLPQVSVSNGTWIQQAAQNVQNSSGGVGVLPYGPNPFTLNQNGGVGALPYGPALPLPTPERYYPSAANRGMSAQQPRGTTVTSGSYSESEYGTPGVMNPNILDSLAARIAANPAEYDRLPPAQRDALDSLINVRSGNGGGAGGQTLGKGDFYGYERDPETGRSKRVVKNAATGGDFSKELRWDPQRKKYVQIGKLLREGKLDLGGGWHKKGRRKGGGGRRKNPVGPKETTSGFTGSYGVVNFNTGTG